MAKRRNTQSEERRKKAKQDADALLSGAVFNSWDDQEQSYELEPRTAHKQVTEGLPIKRDGKVERVVVEAPEPEPEEPEEPEEPAQPVEQAPPKEEFSYEGTAQERLVQMKEEIAQLAQRLIEDPEENTACLTRLRKMAMSKNFALSQLSIISLVPVFTSLAPGYKIRQLTETEKKEKVSKDVARLRGFEQNLIYNYKMFVEYLGQLGKISRSNSQNNKKITESQVKLGQLALKTCCELANSSLKFFNYRNELLTIMIKRLNKKPQDIEDHRIFTKCIRVLETLLVEDKEHGELSFDLANILTKVITEKKFRVDESVINIFLSLSILDDYAPNEAAAPREKLKKKDRVHLSKKQRKARKEMKEIEQELEQAKQSITAEEREKFQSRILQMLLKLYLELLKAQVSDLMASVLEGLSKFGKMANFDLLGDFLEVLREIMIDTISNKEDEGGLYTSAEIRTVLLCIMTSFQLTLNHRNVGKLPIAIDLSKFISNLYLVFADLSLDPDLEFSSKSLRLLDPLSALNEVEKPAVNVSTKAELLLNCLDSIFFRSRNGTTDRALAFTKRLYLSVLHTPEKTSLALLKFVGKLSAKQGETLKGLWNTEERISGEGHYLLGVETDVPVELERCNAPAATLWESVLLDRHYSPMVRDGSRSLMKHSK